MSENKRQERETHTQSKQEWDIYYYISECYFEMFVNQKRKRETIIICFITYTQWANAYTYIHSILS